MEGGSSPSRTTTKRKSASRASRLPLGSGGTSTSAIDNTQQDSSIENNLGELKKQERQLLKQLEEVKRKREKVEQQQQQQQQTTSAEEGYYDDEQPKKTKEKFGGGQLAQQMKQIITEQYYQKAVQLCTQGFVWDVSPPNSISKKYPVFNWLPSHLIDATTEGNWRPTCPECCSTTMNRCGRNNPPRLVYGPNNENYIFNAPERYICNTCRDKSHQEQQQQTAGRRRRSRTDTSRPYSFLTSHTKIVNDICQQYPKVGALFPVFLTRRGGVDLNLLKDWKQKREVEGKRPEPFDSQRMRYFYKAWKESGYPVPQLCHHTSNEETAAALSQQGYASSTTMTQLQEVASVNEACTNTFVRRQTPVATSTDPCSSTWTKHVKVPMMTQEEEEQEGHDNDDDDESFSVDEEEEEEVDEQQQQQNNNGIMLDSEDDENTETNNEGTTFITSQDNHHHPQQVNNNSNTAVMMTKATELLQQLTAATQQAKQKQQDFRNQQKEESLKLGKKRKRKQCKVPGCPNPDRCLGGYNQRKCLMNQYDFSSKQRRRVKNYGTRTCALCHTKGCPGHSNRENCRYKDTEEVQRQLEEYRRLIKERQEHLTKEKSRKRRRKECKVPGCPIPKRCPGGYNRLMCVQYFPKKEQSPMIRTTRKCALCQTRGCPGHSNRQNCIHSKKMIMSL